uniref:Flavodoxin n=1 Tax=Anisakis simplex TaxID=6269 RepID=A0A0M3JIY3_ANISI
LSEVVPDLGGKTDNEHWEQEIHKKVVDRLDNF